MPKLKVHIACSHQWQHDRLMSDARPPTTFQWAAAGHHADLVIYIVPPWPDCDAPERLNVFRALRDLLAGRLYLFSQDDGGVPWAPGVFVSATADSPRDFVGGFYIHPDQFDEGGVGPTIESASTIVPDLLWSFIGTSGTAPVRAQLMALNDERAVVRESSTPWEMPRPQRERLQAEYVETLLRSRFVACPRGLAPSSHRLFETMRAGRVPVVLSDAWRPPPLIDWNACVIRVPEADVARMPDILREREHDAEKMGRRARRVWEERFSPYGMAHQLVESCLLLHEHRRTPLVRVVIAVKAIPHRQTFRRLRMIGVTNWAHRTR